MRAITLSLIAGDIWIDRPNLQTWIPSWQVNLIIKSGWSRAAEDLIRSQPHDGDMNNIARHATKEMAVSG
jgi:hypothetical protein